ncbi:MAG: TIGR02253 family HAD-type hydrolase [Candidatus Bilamarchaeaceae archaeon]
MLRAVLFDLDNTLIDFLTFKKETAKAAAKAMVAQGFPMTEVETYGRIFSIYDEKGIEYQKTFYDVIRPLNLEVNRAERIQQAAIVAYLKRKFEVLKPYSMVKPVLRKLREFGLKLGVVTDAPRNKTWQRLVLTGLENEFDTVITKDDTLAEKPHPSPFQLALQRLGLPPTSCLFVGDNPVRDIKGAKNVGMQTCLAKYGIWQRATEPKADFEIEKFEDLLEIVKKLK